jgi:hypothetical protein
MVVRLQTADGKIRTYKTVQSKVGGEYGPDIYVTKCGREWNKKPKPNEECNHLECAVSIAKADTRAGPLIAVLLFAISSAFFQGLEGRIWAGILLLLAFFFLILGLRAGKRFIELTEYRDKGTIDGFKASQLFEYQEYDPLGCTIYLLINWMMNETAGRFLAAIAAIFFCITAIAELEGVIAPVKYTFVISMCSSFLAICCWSLGRKEKKAFG